MNYSDMPSDLGLRKVPVVSSPQFKDTFGIYQYSHKEDQSVIVPSFIKGDEAHLDSDNHAYINFIEIASVFEDEQTLWMAVCEQASYLIDSEDPQLITTEARKLLASMEWWYCGC